MKRSSRFLFWTLAVLVLGQSVFLAFFSHRHENAALFWGAEAAGLLSVLFFILFYRRLIRPFRVLQSGMRLLEEQDFSVRLKPVANREANRIISVFNRMIAQLKKERTEIREKNHFLDLLIQASPQGLVILDLDEKITEINPAAAKLLGIGDRTAVVGKKLEEADFPLAETLSSLSKDQDRIVHTPERNIYRCVRSSFLDRSFDHPFILVEELTEEVRRLEKKSYERIIRTLSHEVNNSMGAVGSSLQVVSDILARETEKDWEDVRQAVDASYRRCYGLADFIDNFARVVRLPEPSPSDVRLNEMIRSVEALTRSECTRRNIRLEVEPCPSDPHARIDGILFEQVLVNLVKNAYEAVGSDGAVRLRVLGNPKSIRVEDNGPGITEEVKKRLFTPFFTTKSQGQGIGLMFAREVLEKHGCRFHLSSGEGTTVFGIFFPE